MCQRKFSPFLTIVISIGCLFIMPTSGHAHYCSDSREKCDAKCEKIRLNDIEQRECYALCREDYAQCLKERPHCAAEDKCCALQREVRDLRDKVHFLERKLHSQARDQN